MAADHLPAVAGPLHSFGLRAHRYTHAAPCLSLSISPGGLVYCAQPHDQIPLRCTSFATCFAASTWSFTVSNHARAGSSPSRPPVPFAVWKPRKIPSFAGGMPSEVKSVSESRNSWRSMRLPSTGPCL